MERDYERDWPDLVEDIERLVFANKEFIVFIDKDIDVDWKTSQAYDEREKQHSASHNEILIGAATLECIPSDHQPKNVRLNFKRMIGEAIARSLEHDSVNATKMLGEARRYITERNTEKSRYWYLKASGLTALAFATAGIIGWSLREYFITMLGATAFFLVLSSIAGALGALLSVIMRLGKAMMDPAAGKKLHYLEGFYRIIAGCVSAFVVALCVKLELLVPIFSKIEHTQIAMVLGGLAAGVSERLAPSLVSKIDLRESVSSGGK